jgi:hypothetical protein
MKMVNETGSLASLAVTAPRATPVVQQATAGVSARLLSMPSARPPDASLSLYAQVVSERAERSERLAQAALDVRKADQSLKKADALLAQIKENLTHIVKQYPPYGPDSPERLKYLNAISGLRKQLDALAFPPERAQESGVPVPQVPAQALRQVPELDPAAASDDDLRSALAVVAQVRQEVAERGEAMWRDVAGYVGATDPRQVEADVLSVQRYAGEQEVSVSSAGLGLGRRDGLAEGL